MQAPQIEILERDGGVTFPVRLYPRAGREGIGGVRAGRLKIEVTPGPVNNQANRALIRLLKRHLGVPQSAVSIIRGATGRDKLIRVEGMTAERLKNIFPGDVS